MEYLILILAYLLGSISWALVIGKVFYKTDIRNSGSGNLGGTNAGRVLGKKAGAAVMTLDILKCVLAVFLGSLFSPAIGALSGIFCTFGHCFPIFAGFKGGKAVSTSAGLLFSICLFLGQNWLILVIPLIVFLLVLYFGKMVSLASMLACITASIVTCFLSPDWVIRGSIIALSLMIIYRHHANIQRIRKGEESKVTWL